MKKITVSLLLLFLAFGASAQTKILDSNIDWPTGTLTVYLADSVAINSLDVSLGSQHDSTDLLNSSFNSPSLSGNMLVVSLGTFSPRDYYVTIKVNLPNGIVDEMEYKSTY